MPSEARRRGSSGWGSATGVPEPVVVKHASTAAQLPTEAGQMPGPAGKGRPVQLSASASPSLVAAGASWPSRGKPGPGMAGDLLAPRLAGGSGQLEPIRLSRSGMPRPAFTARRWPVLDVLLPLPLPARAASLPLLLCVYREPRLRDASRPGPIG